MSIVLLMPTTEYIVGEEYTPERDPRTINYFIPVINWTNSPIQAKGWNDDTYDRIHSYAIFFRDYDDIFTVIIIDFFINRSNGKIKISNAKHIDITSAGVGIYEINKIGGIGLNGIIS